MLVVIDCASPLMSFAIVPFCPFLTLYAVKTTLLNVIFGVPDPVVVPCGPQITVTNEPLRTSVNNAA